jgi:TPR repeat protein
MIAMTAAPNQSPETAGKPSDQPVTPPETRTRAQETVPNAEHVADAREPMIATTVTPSQSPETAGKPAASPDRVAVTADQPVRPAPATVPTALSEATVLEHAGDVREAPAVRALPVAGVRPLLERGGTMLARGDIVAARLFYERAAALGSGEAATSLGKTYDPAFLLSIAAAGTTANPGLAASWYRKAATLGDPEAARRLATMTANR